MNTLNSFVNKKEADALKEMIFKRARERAQAMTDDIQSDIMDIARESFVSKDNPFSAITSNNNNTEISNNQNAGIYAENKNYNEIGFPERKLNSHALEQTKIVSEKASAAAINNTMEEARAGLSNKRSFMGALNFLNSQAAVSLMRTKSDIFEAIA